MSKFTAGPWHMCKNGNDDDYHIAPDAAFKNGARWYQDKVADHINENDARLIAAAPELLAALEAALQYMQDYNKCSNSGLLNDMREAIAKATGAP